MFQKSKYNKANSNSLNYKSNINVSQQSSKYHPNIYSKKKSTMNKNNTYKSNNKFFQSRTWKKQNNYNNWNKENETNFLNYEQHNSNHDNNQYYYNKKEKNGKKHYYNKEYSYLYTNEINEGEKPRNPQKKEKKISIDYATTQSNSSSHEEFNNNNNQYNSNDKNENITVTNDYNNKNEIKTLKKEEEKNNAKVNLINVNKINDKLEGFNLLNFKPNITNSINNINPIFNTENNINNINNNNNLISDISNINNININTIPFFPLPIIAESNAQSTKNKKQNKNKKFCLSNNDLDIKKSISENISNNTIDTDFQSNIEPYNKFNSVNNELITPIINPIIENTEILQVNVKIAKDKNVIFKLRRFDDLFLTVKLFCEINSIEEKFMKPIITKALCTLNSIYQVYNTQLDSKNIKVLQMLKTFNNETAI